VQEPKRYSIERAHRRVYLQERLDRPGVGRSYRRPRERAPE
jgi:hypothetical protein